MRLFRFDSEVSRRIEHYDSSFMHALLSRTAGGAVQVSVMHFAPGDHVGYHEATVPQLFAVLAGDGWVQDTSQRDVAISAGRAAFWRGGEGHAARTENGMTAVVIEGEHVDPAAVMREV